MRKFVWIGLFLVVSVLPVLTVARVLSLQKLYNKGFTQKEKKYTERGAIFDRNGNILAMEINSWNVGLRLIDTVNPNEVLSILSKSLNIPLDTLKKMFINPQKYVRVKKFISKEEYDTLMEYKTMGELYGVQINEVDWRKYPGNDSIAHLIGYYGEEGRGLDGVEASYDSYLASKNNKGIGNSVYLTIDSVLQKSIEEIIKEYIEESHPEYISTILMEANTGDILSYVELPSYNLNEYYTYPQDRLKNKIITDIYEPGSVFKVFSMASLLDSGVVNEHMVFDASRPYVDPQYNFVINDIDYHGVISTSDIIKYSSNVGISLASYPIDKNLFYSYLKSFGFGEKSGINLPGESRGVFNPPEYWSGRSKQTIALGQEIGITAMQIIKAATAIANEGNLLHPNIVEKILDYKGNVVYQSNPLIERKIIKTETAQSLLRMMNSATEGGTARRIKVQGINISAKTGTAQVFDNARKEYSKTEFIASTLAIVPTEDPQIIVYAVIHKPTTGPTYGGRTTAPMIRKMFDFILPYLGLAGHRVELEDIYSSSIPKQNNVRSQYVAESIKDYRGMSKREIWTLFANTNLTVTMKGEGKVVSQKPAPGTPIEATQSLELYFE